MVNSVGKEAEVENQFFGKHLEIMHLAHAQKIKLVQVLAAHAGFHHHQPRPNQNIGEWYVVLAERMGGCCAMAYLNNFKHKTELCTYGKAKHATAPHKELHRSVSA